MLISKEVSQTHRTAITVADSGNDPTTWADTPSAITDMAHGQVLRIYPQITGTPTSLGLRIITIDGSNTQVGSEYLKVADFSEPIDFREGFEGENRVFVQISSLAGTSPSVTLKYSVINYQ